MQLKKFRTIQGPCLAVLQGERWIPLASLPELEAIGADMVTVLAQWSTWRPLIEQALQLQADSLPQLAADAVAIAPFTPLSLRDFMLSEQHAIDAARGFIRTFMPKLLPVVNLYEKTTGKPFPALKPKPIWYRLPVYYFSNHLNTLGDGDTIDWPSYTRYLDYELELAFVIVKPLRNATAQQALDAIGGFMVLNDVSARDVQLEEMRSGFGPQKAKHFVNAMSHTVATADTILPHVERLNAEVRINGSTVVTTSTAGMQHSIAAMLMHASKDETLHPGEVFATGTLPGGCAMETGHWLKPGDQLELWIERVGSLFNTIANQKDS